MKIYVCPWLVALLVAFAAPVRADIYQWEYINPANPVLGKQQSTTLAPDGAGVNAVPGADLTSRNLTMAYLTGSDLRNAYAEYVDLTDADLSQANLSGAWFANSTLTGGDFTGAEVRGSNFNCNFYSGGCEPGGGTGLTPTQITSTASYAAHNLSGIASVLAVPVAMRRIRRIQKGGEWIA